MSCVRGATAPVSVWNGYGAPKQTRCPAAPLSGCAFMSALLRRETRSFGRAGPRTCAWLAGSSGVKAEHASGGRVFHATVRNPLAAAAAAERLTVEPPLVTS